jgi:chromosome segregation ATPase
LASVNDLRFEQVDLAAAAVPRPFLALPDETNGSADVPSVDGFAEVSEEWSQADPLGDAVMSELEDATATLAALGERVKQVASARLTLERELAETRSQLAHLQAEQEAVVERQQARNETLRAKLADVLRELDR